MKHFADERCDAAVVEAGLGGRTDCTNVFDDAGATVITNVDLEHRERLGDTVAAIAREKADIIKGGIAVTGAAHADALAVIEARCRERSARLLRLGDEIRVRTASADACGSVFSARTPYGALRDVRLPLTGAHQVANAALAVAAAQAFADRRGFTLEDDAVREGVSRAWLSGRLETVQTEPRVLLDSAHNPAGARRLARALRDHWLPRGVRLHLVIGVLGDKDQAAIVRALAPLAHRAIITQPPIVERQGDPERMLALFARVTGRPRVAFEPRPDAALDAALDAARPQDIVCVTGSMFLVGALRERWLPEAQILKRRSARIEGAHE
jgi:dihydrofolate synthase/folylpolyglutamate synthase